MTLNNLANLQSKRNDFESAEQCFQEALEICRDRAYTNLDISLLDVTTTLINLGVFYQKSVPDKDRSLAYVIEALRIVSSFKKKKPFLERYVAIAVAVLQDWDMDPKEVLSHLQ